MLGASLIRATCTTQCICANAHDMQGYMSVMHLQPLRPQNASLLDPYRIYSTVPYSPLQVRAPSVCSFGGFVVPFGDRMVTSRTTTVRAGLSDTRISDRAKFRKYIPPAFVFIQCLRERGQREVRTYRTLAHSRRAYSSAGGGSLPWRYLVEMDVNRLSVALGHVSTRRHFTQTNLCQATLLLL